MVTSACGCPGRNSARGWAALAGLLLPLCPSGPAPLPPEAVLWSPGPGHAGLHHPELHLISDDREAAFPSGAKVSAVQHHAGLRGAGPSPRCFPQASSQLHCRKSYVLFQGKHYVHWS